MLRKDVDADGIAVLTLDRPDRRNALSPDLVDALLDAVANPDAGARAFVLTGAGPCFCSGADLTAGLGGGGGSRERFAMLLTALSDCPLPVIAAVNGDAFGAGIGLVAASDLAVIDAGARVGTPEVRLGLFPWIVSAPLMRKIHAVALTELALTGDPIDAARAVAIGLANRVATPGNAVCEARSLALRIVRHSSIVLARGKVALKRAATMDADEALTYLVGELGRNLELEDAAEGIAAFVGKRPPVWKGR